MTATMTTVVVDKWETPYPPLPSLRVEPEGRDIYPPSARASRRESADDYGNIVALLGPAWRVIACADSIQWIVQRKSGVWRSLHFCTSRGGVLRRVRGLPGWEALADLPDRFPTHRKGVNRARSAKSPTPTLQNRLCAPSLTVPTAAEGMMPGRHLRAALGLRRAALRHRGVIPISRSLWHTFGSSERSSQRGSHAELRVNSSQRPNPQPQLATRTTFD
jgi:hypothetical protein